MAILTGLLSLLFFVALAGIAYPFKPFGTRRNAAWSALACFVGVAVFAGISDSYVPPKPSDITESEWSRREKLCTNASGPVEACMNDPSRLAELEKAAERRALEDKVIAAQRAAEQKALAAKQVKETAAKAREDHANYVEMLKREVASLADGVSVKDRLDSKEGIFVTVAMFGAMAKLYDDGKSHKLTPEEQSLREKYRKAVAVAQATAFPKLRSGWGKLLNGALWEADGEARTFDKNQDVVEFVSVAFAANANKKKMYEQLFDSLTQLRFRQVRFKWYKGQDEYTYWKVESPNDKALVLFESGGNRTIN